MAWSRTSQPWQYGQCSTSRPHRSRRPGHVGQLVDQPGGDQQPPRPRPVRPSARVTANPSPSRRGAGHLAGLDHGRRSRRTSARPVRQQLGGRRAVAGEQAVHAVGRRVARRARVDHQHRPPRPGQHQRPVQTRRHRRRSPPRRALSIHSSIRPPPRSTMRRLAQLWQLSLPIWQTAGMDDDLDDASPRSARGCARCASSGRSPWPSSRRQTGISVSTLSRLESGAPPADAGAAAPAGPGVRRHRSTSSSTPRRPATRASTCAR